MDAYAHEKHYKEAAGNYTMENITIPLEEYKKLKKYQKIVQNFEKELHGDELMLLVAKEVDKRVKEGKMKAVSEKELLDELG